LIECAPASTDHGDREMALENPATSEATSKLEDYSRNIAALNAKPLWERSSRMAPGTTAIPAIWRYKDMRPQLLRAAELISTQQAERRVLMLENPGLPGTGYITSSLYSGMQIILPGEVAGAHRHASNAMRFIIEGVGAYSTVEGERVPMYPGDFVLTPYWCWHDHGHAGREPVIWLDALDNPFAQFFGTMFRESCPHEKQALSLTAGHTEARYGAGLLPVEYRGTKLASPLLTYPYDRTREALDKLAKDGPLHPSHGIRMRYANPTTGGNVFPTISVYVTWLPKGFAGHSYRSTESAIFCGVEGRGRVIAGDVEFSFEPHDVFTVPSWIPHRIEAEDECVLFSYSDRGPQETLGLFREENPANS
jgi:gentisate 1,2-dioxygenase